MKLYKVASLFLLFVGIGNIAYSQCTTCRIVRGKKVCSTPIKYVEQAEDAIDYIEQPSCSTSYYTVPKQLRIKTYVPKVEEHTTIYEPTQIMVSEFSPSVNYSYGKTRTRFRIRNWFRR